MLQVIYVFLVVFFVSLIGSLNGLGVSFLLSIALLLLSDHTHSSVLWVLYSSSFLVALLFVVTRPRLMMENITTILSVSCACGFGLLVGKMFNVQFIFLWTKIFLGALIMILSFLLLKIKILSRKELTVYEDVITFSFFDFVFLVLIGFFAGFFDFGVAAFIYILMFLKKKFYDIEKIDISVYFLLLVNAVISLVFTLVRYEQVLPDFIGLNFVFAILAGALCARVFYKMISLNMRKQIVIYGLFFVGLKMIFFNLPQAEVGNALMAFLK